MKKTKELHQMFNPKQRRGTGMGLDEAIGIVLELARQAEFDDVGDFNFEWTSDHVEACGVVDKLAQALAEESENE
jgi:hypothetical protein